MTGECLCFAFRVIACFACARGPAEQFIPSRVGTIPYSFHTHSEHHYARHEPNLAWYDSGVSELFLLPAARKSQKCESMEMDNEMSEHSRRMLT